MELSVQIKVSDHLKNISRERKKNLVHKSSNLCILKLYVFYEKLFDIQTVCKVCRLLFHLKSLWVNFAFEAIVMLD